ncbi:Bug family tripartite tricarboxylate transporter substrate binding protein [Plastoroseomonas hellenica]|uniref:Bug family tripartite tricarboxylate transporter substrate binding protein n=1 Tax=Plastoroseomonas hellenica TaxID=2687306 RepID=UPI002011E75B|nr:tripartite tricarboxylate transporter substrate-binding protein [Plastoroseomonas hellenica]
MRSRRNVTMAALGGVATLSASRPARAQAWPAKPIRVIVPNAAGGVADLTARAVGQALAERLGQPVVIDNRPGAGGVVAAQALTAAAPDGYTLMVATNAHAIAPSLFRSLPYDPLRDLAPIVTLGAFAVALIVPSGSPLRTPADLLARMRREPGAVNIGTISVGSTQHLAAALFKAEAGVEAETVTFPATPALITALLRGDVDVAFEITGPIWGQIEAGELRPIAVTSAARAARLPEVPTLQEGALPGYDVSSWNALVAPGRTPEAMIERLNREADAVLATPALRERLLAAGVEARGGTPGALRALLASEVAKWRTVIERARIERQ